MLCTNTFALGLLIDNLVENSYNTGNENDILTLDKSNKKCIASLAVEESTINEENTSMFSIYVKIFIHFILIILS